MLDSILVVFTVFCAGIVAGVLLWVLNWFRPDVVILDRRWLVWVLVMGVATMVVCVVMGAGPTLVLAAGFGAVGGVFMLQWLFKPPQP